MKAGDALLKVFTGLRDLGPNPHEERTSYAGTKGAVVTASYYHHPTSTAIYQAEYTGRGAVIDRVLTGGEIQAYVNEVLAMPWPRWRGGVTGVRVIEQDGDQAGYRFGELICPSPVRELVVLHELAHHLTFPAPGTMHHAPPFVAAYLDLIEHVMNPAAAQVFSDAFTAQGVGP